MTGCLYEVNLSISPEIEAAFKQWLSTHVRQMLSFPGFEFAFISQSESETSPVSPVSLVVHYFIDRRQSLDDYLKNHAPRMRQDGLDLFGDQFSASRRILAVSKHLHANAEWKHNPKKLWVDIKHLSQDFSANLKTKGDIVPNLNWDKVKAEILRLSNTEELKKELNRLRDELTNFDIQAHLSPAAKKRLKNLEKRYNELLRSANKAQRQFDREFNKALRSLKKAKADATKTIVQLKKRAEQQQAKITKKTKTAKKKTAKKKTAKKKTARKTTAKKKTAKKKTSR